MEGEQTGLRNQLEKMCSDSQTLIALWRIIKLANFHISLRLFLEAQTSMGAEREIAKCLSSCMHFRRHGTTSKITKFLYQTRCSKSFSKLSEKQTTILSINITLCSLYILQFQRAFLKFILSLKESMQYCSFLS